MEKMLRVAYGEALADIAEKNEKIVVLDADLAHATFTSIFQEKYPDRFFNFGIAEANMVCAAAGMAHTGLIPFVSTFSIFGAGRAYEMIRNAVAYTKANVKLACTHNGISVGEDGGSHQSIEDIALMRVIPNMTVLVPCDPIETKKMVYAAAEMNGPVYLRVSRQASPIVTREDVPFTVGHANILKEGSDVCIIAIGLMVAPALRAAEKLKSRGISAEVVNMGSVKPLDEEYVLDAAERFKAIVTVEEHSVIGGLGGAVAECIAGKKQLPFVRIGVEDKFGKSGTPEALMKEYGLSEEHIEEVCINILNKALK